MSDRRERKLGGGSRPTGWAAVRRVEPPENSAVADWYTGADLADAYAMTLPEGAPGTIDGLARAALTHPPAWFSALLRIRDIAVSFAGVKTSRHIQQVAELADGETVAFFPILGRSRNELILGEDDRHLNFRASIMARTDASGIGRELVLMTVVHCHNRMGRLYLRVISPFHRLIVRSNLARLANMTP